jgi:hypothetical protein
MRLTDSMRRSRTVVVRTRDVGRRFVASNETSTEPRHETAAGTAGAARGAGELRASHDPVVAVARRRPLGRRKRGQTPLELFSSGGPLYGGEIT